jgi:prepilin-type N-terminal cleavage/methylation domain-containing protein
MGQAAIISGECNRYADDLGFTLIELLVVIAIIAILAVVAEMKRKVTCWDDPHRIPSHCLGASRQNPTRRQQALLCA